MLKTEHINTGQSIVRKKRLCLLMNLNKNLLKQMLQTYLYYVVSQSSVFNKLICKFYFFYYFVQFCGFHCFLGLYKIRIYFSQIDAIQQIVLFSTGKNIKSLFKHQSASVEVVFIT